MKPLLSILVPTFNRACFLEGLLLELESQLCGQYPSLDAEVLIGNNASTDNTARVLQEFSERNPGWQIIKHGANLGPDANIMALITESRGSYRWIIGDDDRPFPGVIAHILKVLRSDSPSLIYLPSLWHPDISSIQPDPINNLRYRLSSNLNCARELHIWTTFLSSWIFSADQLLAGLSNIQLISSGQGTFFIQLGWILPLLTCPQSRILIVENTAILATSGNTGGYAILRSFLVGYPRLVCRYTRGFFRIRFALIGMALRSYLPSLIAAVRVGKTYSNAGDTAGIFANSIKLLWYYPSYWLLCLPALFLPAGLIKYPLYARSVIRKSLAKFKRLA